MSTRSIRPLVCGVVVAVACSQPSSEGPSSTDGWIRVVGRIDAGPSGSQAALEVPDTVRAGDVFNATVSTYGSTGCIRPDQSDIRQTQSSIDITVYDSLWVGGPPCLPDWHQYARSLALRFDAFGSALVRLHGRGADSMLTLEHTITVRP